MPKNYSELTAIGRALVSGDLIPMWGTTEAQTRRCTYGDIINPLQTQIDANAANIATNTGNISTNAGNISQNASDIAQNTTDIGNNTTAINANTTALTTKVEGPAGATPDNIMVFNGATGYVAKDGGVTIASLQASIDAKMNNAASGVLDNFLSFTADNGKTPKDSGVSAASFDTAGAAAAVQADLDAHKDADNFHMTANQNAAMDAAAAPSAGNPIATIADIAAGGGGDVIGPAGATDGNLAVFDGPTGKIIRDGGPPGAGGASQLSELSDVDSATQTAGFVLASSGANYLGRALIASDIPDLSATYLTPGAAAGIYAPLTRNLIAGTGLNGGGDLSADRTFNLANTAVTPGAYTSADITVDAQGRITAAANGTGGGGDLSNAEFPDSAHFASQVVADATVAFTDSNKQTVNAATHAALTLSAPGVGSYILQITNSGSLTSITPTPRWDGGQVPTWGGTSILALYYDGTNWYGSAMVSAA